MEHDICGGGWGGEFQFCKILRAEQRPSSILLTSPNEAIRSNGYNQPTPWLFVSGNYKGSGPSEDTE